MPLLIGVLSDPAQVTFSQAQKFCEWLSKGDPRFDYRLATFQDLNELQQIDVDQFSWEYEWSDDEWANFMPENLEYYTNVDEKHYFRYVRVLK